MIIQVKQACEFTSKDGEKFHCFNGFVGLAPEWVQHDDYFKAMCASGLITAHIDTKSVDEAVKAEEPKRKRG